MRYVCPVCGNGGADHKDEPREYWCHTRGCMGKMVVEEESPFEVWWKREFQTQFKRLGMPKHAQTNEYVSMMKRLARVAWYNGAYSCKHSLEVISQALSDMRKGLDEAGGT